MCLELDLRIGKRSCGKRRTAWWGHCSSLRSIGVRCVGIRIPRLTLLSISYEDNIEFRCGKGGGWNLIDNSSDGSVEDDRFVIGDLMIGMIVETEQAKGVEVILAKETEEDEEVPWDIWAAGKHEAEAEDGNKSCWIRLFGQYYSAVNYTTKSLFTVLLNIF